MPLRSAACARCRWWRPLAGMDRGWGVCSRVSSPDRPSRARFTVVVVEGLLETAELLTHESFGCREVAPKLKRLPLPIYDGEPGGQP